jgi:hypothetical protein
VSERPSKNICSELQKVKENNLTENDLKSLSMAIYRERRKRHPTLPKSREDVHTALDGMTIETSKSENMCLINDQESGIIIFSCTSNLRVLCTQVEEIFTDGTFKSYAKFFEQLYTVHGFRNVHYVPFIFALLSSKSVAKYTKFLDFASRLCSERSFTFEPCIVHVHFEVAMLKCFKQMFPTTEIQCCRFHLGQSWWRKVQKLGLSKEYKEKDCDIGKWLASFIGLPFLDASDIEDCLVEDLMSDMPADPRCSLFADYILKNYVAFLQIFGQLPSLDSKCTTNAAESFHAHYNEQLYAAHPIIFAFLDVITKIQITTYIKIRTLYQPAVVRRSETN